MENAIKNGQSDMSEFKLRLQEFLRFKDERMANLQREIKAMGNNRNDWKFKYSFDHQHKCKQIIIDINLILVLFQIYDLNKQDEYVRTECLLAEMQQSNPKVSVIKRQK